MATFHDTEIRFEGAAGQVVSMVGMPALRCFKATITHADLDAAATSQAIALTGFPTNVVVLGASTKYRVRFVGPSITGLTIDVGDTADADELVDARELITGTPALDAGDATTPGLLIAPTAQANYIGDGLDATFTATGANVAALTAGEIDVFIVYYRQADLKAL